MNPADFILLFLVALLFFFAVRYAWRHRNSACGGDCSSCPYHQECSKKNRKK